MFPTYLRKQKTKHFTRAPVSRIDRISTLPTEILHHIMTFLPNKYALRTSVVSKRFSSLYWSLPTISFDENELKMYANRKGLGESSYTRNIFVDHMKQCYMSHDLRFVETLRIHASDPINAWDIDILSSMVESFIFAAVEGGALKEMDLEFPLAEEPPNEDHEDVDIFYASFYMMPETPLFSWCETLQSLRLEGCSFEEFGTMVENIKLPSVREISIRNCLISDNFVTKLVHGCPELEHFSLKFCLDVDVIRFSHSKLKKLILGCHDTSIVFRIDVPNLQTFKFRGAYWQHEQADPTGELELRDDDHIIDAPNLESFSIKYACLDMSSIQLALTKYKNLREMVLSHCSMGKVPKFWGDKIENLVISHCQFMLDGGLLLTESLLPVLRSLTVYSCRGIEWLSIKSTTLEDMSLRECVGLEEWVICAPKVSCYCGVNLGN